MTNQIVKLDTVKISNNERKCLEILAERYEDGDGDTCYYTKYIAKMAVLDPKKARIYIRSLVRKGLVEYHRGLFNDDGQVAGSGYKCSERGFYTINPEVTL